MSADPHHAAPPARAGWLLALLPLAAFAGFATQIAPVVAGATPRLALAWVPSLDVAFSLQLDGLSLLFALLISGIGTLITIYAGGYLSGHPQLGRFYALLLLFTVAMVGLVCAGDVITLFVFWELTSISSYLLIGFDHERAAARAAALQALLVTGGGGLALLAGLLLLRQVAGGGELWRLSEQAAAIHASALYLPILLLVLAGACTKSAQVPFHFWLPGAMEAPAPVSAYLHSATMVTAGVYLLARLQPALGGSPAWHYLVSLAGAATMVTGAVLALAQRDLKRLLAYSTVSALGTLVLLLGLGTALAAQAAMLFLVVHSLYKGALFMVAGAVDHETGRRDVTALGGLRRAMPWLAAAALAAGLSMAGLPPLLGFISKELLYEAKLQAPAAAAWITAAGVLANVLTVAVAGAVAVRPFWGAARGAPPGAHEPPLALLLGPLVLAALGLVIGAAPDALLAPLIAAAAGAVRGEPTTIALALWHGLNPVLALSAVTIAAGVALHAVDARRRAEQVATGLRSWAWLTPGRAYQRAVSGLLAVAGMQTRVLQSGSLSAYVLIVFATLLATVGTAVLWHPIWWRRLMLAPVNLPEVAVCLMMIAAALAATRTTSRLAAIAALGAVGYGIALLFVFFGAPDLALTQFAIETLTVILFLLVIYRLPPFSLLSSPAVHRRDALLAGGVGALMAALVLVASASPLPSRLAPYFAAQSVPGGHGGNVVNVILVDFRALDTLGESVVLAVAAIGVWSLMRLRRDAAPMAPAPAFPPSLLFRIATRYVFPLLLLFSIFLLLRGHDAPGGGFVGGLTAAAAFALYLLAFGTAAARQRLRVAPQALIGGGLLLAGLSGLPAMAVGQPYLTGLWAGALGTPLLFDGGVYLVVVGVVLLMLFSLAED
ncbi:putative monovalent cation/H+ antiporter subunit A [bacterium]|nr:putative monovalent cation/H+ antiporter subunit A [bacterium]